MANLNKMPRFTKIAVKSREKCSRCLLSAAAFLRHICFTFSTTLKKAVALFTESFTMIQAWGKTLSVQSNKPAKMRDNQSRMAEDYWIDISAGTFSMNLKSPKFGKLKNFSLERKPLTLWSADIRVLIFTHK